jgi:hypothetical protein
MWAVTTEKYHAGEQKDRWADTKTGRHKHREIY